MCLRYWIWDKLIIIYFVSHYLLFCSKSHVCIFSLYDSFYVNWNYICFVLLKKTSDLSITSDVVKFNSCIYFSHYKRWYLRIVSKVVTYLIITAQWTFVLHMCFILFQIDVAWTLCFLSFCISNSFVLSHLFISAFAILHVTIMWLAITSFASAICKCVV